MSRETEKVFKEFQQFLGEDGAKDMTDKELQQKIDEFLSQYNGSLPEPVTPENAKTTDDYMELAFMADNRNDALRYAKKALQLDPHNFDAEVFLIEEKTDDFTRLAKDMSKTVERATKYMEAEGFFDEECIGDFWGILETRPYMRLRHRYLQALLECGRFGMAKQECEELLRLCENDNMGVRYQLMHLYAFFEQEEAALALCKRFGGGDDSQMLLPLAILYYKAGDETKAKQYLRRLNNANKGLKQFLKKVTEGDRSLFDDFRMGNAYQLGSLEELQSEFQENMFLFMGMEPFDEWALQQVKQFK